MQCFAPWQYILLPLYWLLQLNSYAILSSMAIQTITTIVVVELIKITTICCIAIDPRYCNQTIFCCLSLLPYHILQQLSTKVILLQVEGTITNMTLLQQYFTVAIDPFSSSVLRKVSTVVLVSLP
jgi:hypothetical protein